MTDSFILSPEHLEFRDVTRRFARDELADGYLARSRSHDFPHDEHKRLGAAGFLDLQVPEDAGGQGADLIALGLACEEFGYADPNFGYLIFATNMLTALLATHPSAALRDLVAPLAAGELLGCWAFTEPGGGSDAGNPTTRARRSAGGWRLTGEKTSVTLAAHADVAVVLAQTEPGSRSKGIGAFLVPCRDGSVGTQAFDDPGFRPLGRSSLMMDDTFVPDDHVVGVPGTGLGQVLGAFDLSRTCIGLVCVGAAQRALDSAVAYARERVAFGRPIAANQGVSFPIAEHATYLAAVRALALHALGLRQADMAHTSEAAMLKWWAPRVAFLAIQDAIVLHGQVGWSEELPLQALLRDVSGYQIGDGTPQIQKLVIARQLLGRDVVG